MKKLDSCLNCQHYRSYGELCDKYPNIERETISAAFHCISWTSIPFDPNAIPDRAYEMIHNIGQYHSERRLAKRYAASDWQDAAKNATFWNTHADELRHEIEAAITERYNKAKIAVNETVAAAYITTAQELVVLLGE